MVVPPPGGLHDPARFALGIGWHFSLKTTGILDGSFA
jgi:hypothetical protein